MYGGCVLSDHGLLGLGRGVMIRTFTKSAWRNSKGGKKVVDVN